MTIGGLQKLTLIDFPGKIACTVFTVGCNFRCPFCHNPELVDPAGLKLSEIIDEKDFFSFLESRKSLLDGVCITGGEPTLHSDLPEFIKKIKKMGFLVKLDTNGTNPGVVSSLIEGKAVDYFAMDIKTRLQDVVTYSKVVRIEADVEKIKKTIKLIMDSGVDYEFRTTVVPGLHAEEDILCIADSIRGAKKYFLQQFRPGKKILDKECGDIKPYPEDFLKTIKDKIKGFFEICEVRE